jgi:uncharacterized protein YkwD
MRRWGILSVVGLCVAMASIVTAVPAHAADIDAGAAARQFFDLTNGERAAVGVPALQWRDDVAGMAISQSAAMANAGTIWHGSFVSQTNLRGLHANLLAENVGMGGDVETVHQAFMNSEHHRENILDPGLNQLGVGVVVAGDGTVYVTEDFLHVAGATAPRPATAAAPVSRAAAPRPASTPAPKAAAAKVAVHPVAASAAPSIPPTTSTTAAPAPVPVGVVNPVAFEPAPAVAASAVSAGVLTDGLDGGAGLWIVMFGVLLLVAALGGLPLRSAMHRARDQHREAP